MKMRWVWVTGLAMCMTAHAAARKPNIILIMADDMGYECIGANGCEDYETPNIDTLAAEGMRFDQCFANPLCTPSRVKIMTGLYNKRNFTKFAHMDRDQVTFAHLLKDAGYATAIAGKWQLGVQPDSAQHFGFDQSCLWRHNAPGSRYPNPGLSINGEPMQYSNGEYGPDVCTDFICDFIETNQDKPFFAYYPMILPHCPFAPTPDSEDWDSSVKGWPYKGPGDAAMQQKNFKDMVQYIDKLVGKIVNTLDELGIRDNTMIIFTADNGTDEPIVTHWNGKKIAGRKAKPFNAGVRVPLVINWPGRIEPAVHKDELVEFSDFLPTLCEVAGAPLPVDYPGDGLSLWSVLAGTGERNKEYVYIWYFRFNTWVRTKDLGLICSRKNRAVSYWKYPGHYEGQRLELDSATKEEQAVLKQLEKVLDDMSTQDSLFMGVNAHKGRKAKERSEGDLKIEYEYTRLDQAPNCVNIPYVSRPEPGGEAGAELDIGKLRSELRARSAESVEREAGQPLVRSEIIKDWNGRGDFTRKYNQSIIRFAYRVFALNEEAHLADANAALREMCEYHLARPQTLLEKHSFQDAMRNTGILHLRYGPQGREAPGRMSPETCAVVENTPWAWTTEKSRMAESDVEQSQTWWIYHSENHHANQFSGCWVASKILKDIPRYANKTFKDGHTPGEHFDAWTTYAKEYILQRARKGMLLEIDSPSYTTATLSFVETCHALADDPVLKKRAGQFRELYWALVAEEQLAGITGGAMTRCYLDHAMRGSGFLPGAAWHVLGVGEDNGRPYYAKSWEAPDTVLKIAHRWPERAPYEIRQRRMGLAVPGYDRPSQYRLRTDFGGLLRYTWCTPDFIMGSFLHAPRPTQDWVAISSQNRWSGITLRGGGRVFATPYNAKGGNILNGLWSVQSKGSMISQQLPGQKKGKGTSHDWRVFFSKAGLTRPVREGRWIFAEAPNAFVGVCVVEGVAAFAEEAPRFGQWLVCEDKDTPVILEAARKSDFGSFEAFRKRTLAQSVSMEHSVLTYQGLGGDTLTFHADRSCLPSINGKPVELAPDKVYDSPFVQSEWDSGVVAIQFGDEKRVLDFNGE